MRWWMIIDRESPGTSRYICDSTTKVKIAISAPLRSIPARNIAQWVHLAPMSAVRSLRPSVQNTRRYPGVHQRHYIDRERHAIVAFSRYRSGSTMMLDATMMFLKSAWNAFGAEEAASLPPQLRHLRPQTSTLSKHHPVHEQRNHARKP